MLRSTAPYRARMAACRRAGIAPAPDAAAILTITWRELAGPPIKTPVRSGYGSSLIRDLIPHELGGTVDLTFPSDGACCKIEIPLEGSAKIIREDSLRSAIMDYDAVSTGVR